MKNKKIDFLYKKHKGQWVLVSENYSKVYASSKNFDELMDELEEKKPKKGVIVKVPQNRYSSYVG